MSTTEPTRVLTDAQVQNFADRLRGQCVLGLDRLCEEIGIDWNMLTAADLEAIDSEVFQCERCGWWDDVSEMAENEDGETEQYCKECQNGE